MSWRYQMTHRTVTKPWGETEDVYEVREVYSSYHNGKPSWTENAIAAVSETEEGLVEVLEMMLRDVQEFDVLEVGDEAGVTPDVEDEVLADWEDFWRELVVKDGKLDLAQVARELFDYHVAMRQVAIVYCDLTGSRFSKPNTRAEYVIEAAREYLRMEVGE